MDNVKKLKAAYKAWNDEQGQGISAWLDLLAENVVCHSLGGVVPGMKFTNPLQGKAKMVRYLSELGKNWQMVHYTPVSFIAQGNHVAVLGSCAWKSRKTGKKVSTSKADFFRFEAGKVVEFWEFYDTAKAIAATT